MTIVAGDRPNFGKIFSFFSGAGFLDLGFETSGFDIVYVNEIFSPFLAAYRYSRQLLNLPLPEYGYYCGEEHDISKLLLGTAANLPDFIQDCRRYHHPIGFIGGPPCPDFSVGGKNRGQFGDNGKLSAAYVELICHYQPDFFLFENVKGLWKTHKHRLFFESLKRKLKLAGYLLTTKLINCIEYGVPQNRERIIIIGFSQKFCTSKDSRLDYRFPWHKYVLYNQEKIFQLPWIEKTLFQENSIFPCPENIIPELTVEYWFRKNHVTSHPNSHHYFQPRAGITKLAAIDEGDDSGKSYKRLHRWRFSPTACYGNNEVHLHPYKIRRISVAEALAIQSLPQKFALPENMSLTNMFKTIGNGVPYFTAKAIAQNIRDFLDEKL
ncbi:DNA cytosine methyltransferase [Calothrix sp. 336/3]|uniref:DNA cytosine methyltransferase n=1 Tax=Calothrix sp. 336/3 TaxID=1337936 RepID=UPI0004E4016D|nr:DNA cytosine methyltransferase [Calothrix sp. 336/3]AKG24098.1 modification methylase NmeDIP [Calothrix sp. 336/3]